MPPMATAMLPPTRHMLPPENSRFCQILLVFPQDHPFRAFTGTHICPLVRYSGLLRNASTSKVAY
jgi:hypothetical protein